MNSILNSLLDSSLYDLADLPAFKVIKPGAHKVIIDWEEKKINDHPALEMKLKLVETLELADPSSAPDEPGTESSVVFMLDNEFGQGNLKTVLKPIGAHLGIDKLVDIVTWSKGMEVTVITKQRKDKEDKDRVYLQVKSVICG